MCIIKNDIDRKRNINVMFGILKNKFNKKLSDIKYANAFSMAASLCNSETFKDIKGIMKGEDIAICGGGPSLQYYKPIEDVHHFALNRALLNKKVKYEYFVADDWDGVYFFKDELEKYECKKFFGHQIGDFSRQIPESFSIKCQAKRYYTDSFIVGNGYDSKFICDIDKMAIGNMPNIALSAMQIALFMNPRRIYLVGCDASQGHFVQPKILSDDDIKRHENDSKMAVSGDQTIKKWCELKEFAKTFYPDTEIISINPVGLKGIFKDEYQQ